MRIEIRNNSVVLDGYVNAVERDSKPLLSPQGLFIEQIKTGAFKRALERNNDVKLLFNHKEDRQLGSMSEGNLTLIEDNIGLRAVATVNDPEVVEKAKNGELRGWSFGFYILNDTWEDSEPYKRRHVNDMELTEVSILDCTPAYNGTSVEARNDKEVLTETRGQEFQAVTVQDEHEQQDPQEQQEEKREYDYSVYLNEIQELKGFK